MALSETTARRRKSAAAPGEPADEYAPQSAAAVRSLVAPLEKERQRRWFKDDGSICFVCFAFGVGRGRPIRTPPLVPFSAQQTAAAVPAEPVARELRVARVRHRRFAPSRDNAPRAVEGLPTRVIPRRCDAQVHEVASKLRERVRVRGPGDRAIFLTLAGGFAYFHFEAGPHTRTCSRLTSSRVSPKRRETWPPTW